MRCHHKTSFYNATAHTFEQRCLTFQMSGCPSNKKKHAGVGCDVIIMNPSIWLNSWNKGMCWYVRLKFQARPEQMKLIEVKVKNVQFFTGSSLVLTIKTHPFGRFPTDFHLFSATRQVAPKPGILQLLIWP
jgi:hypothetical protein